MTARRPRRRRRRDADRPAPTLPRPNQVARDSGGRSRALDVESPSRRPIHHVVRDYSYIRADLVTVGVVTFISVAFVVVVSFFA